MSFKQLNIIHPILKALDRENYSKPTPIQIEAIPPAIEGKDLLGSAQTGTGKTAAFAIPTLQRLAVSQEKHQGSSRVIRALVLTPTRELAMQISERFKVYGQYTGLRSCVIFGGVSQRPQEQKLRHGVDIIIATPGRLYDLMQQGIIKLGFVETLILDEADQMLDMGFLPDVRRIIATTPAERQTLFFSATMPTELEKLSRTILKDPVRISIAPEKPTLDVIEQAVYHVVRKDKPKLLLHLLQDEEITSAIVFTRTKHGADRVTKHLLQNDVQAQVIHGNKSQSYRQMALRKFKNKQTRILVATDIAARGIDITELSHVFNFDLPEVSETYIHRIGRTGRAGKSGKSVSFCDREERKYLRNIERLCGKDIPLVDDHPYMTTAEAEPSRQQGNYQPRSNARPRQSGSGNFNSSTRSNQGGGSKSRRSKSGQQGGKSGDRPFNQASESNRRQHSGSGQSRRRKSAS